MTITDVFLDQKRVNVCEYVVPSLLHVYIHLLSSDRERHLWSFKYFNQVSLCLYVTFVQRFLHFLVRVFPFFSYFLYNLRIIWFFFVIEVQGHNLWNGYYYRKCMQLFLNLWIMKRFCRFTDHNIMLQFITCGPSNRKIFAVSKPANRCRKEGGSITKWCA